MPETFVDRPAFTMPADRRSRAATRMGRIRKIVRVICAVLVAAGLCTLAVLAGMSWQSRAVAESSITELSAKCDALSDEARIQVELQARAYNSALANPSSAPGQDIWPYEKQLLFDREPMMSFIEIPKISARLPIYHGTSDAALMAGVGHYKESSLPVGGADSHCVLMGHSGMRGSTMFDQLEDMQVGDVFVIWTLSVPYAYRVNQIQVVEPTDVASLHVEEGRDLVTLVTCTPYGVNSHRLLVHAERCDYMPEETHMPAVLIDRRDSTLLAALGACGIAGILAAIGALVRRRKTQRSKRTKR